MSFGFDGGAVGSAFSLSPCLSPLTALCDQGDSGTGVRQVVYMTA